MSGGTCILIGAPLDCGKRRRGCSMGPEAYRVAGLAETLADLGWRVEDRGDVPGPKAPPPAPAGQVHARSENIEWTRLLSNAARDAMATGFPIFLGGDHALSLGTVSGVADHAAAKGRPLFVLWLDAHPDIHSPATSASGNLHGTPIGYVTGQPGFDGFPPMANPVPPRNICFIGLRSVDGPERAAIQSAGMRAIDMRQIDERGIAAPLADKGLALYAQHVDPMETGTLVDIFRDDPRASLLGTDSLRDGVDVPGDSLRLVIMEGVPWPKPDILHRARKLAGGGTQYDDMIIRARLAQAFGRLIRRADDRGRFVMLSSAFPSRLLSAFPPGTPVRRCTLSEALQAVQSGVSARGNEGARIDPVTGSGGEMR